MNGKQYAVTSDAETAADLHRLVPDAVARGRASIAPPPGEHRCSGTLLPERFCHVSNNDHGIKRILLDVDRAENLVIEGQGAHLVFFGEVMPIRVGFSRNITIRDLTIDWHRPFFTQAEVAASGPGFVEFRADPVLYPLRVDRGRLIARDDQGWRTDTLWNLLPFDPVRREVSSREENWHVNRWHRARELAPGPENFVEVRDCVFGAKRGRGLLLNMEHRTLIENNHFHVSGRAIESVPDANYWWEAGPFENLTIRGNTFEDCNYGPCGETLIHVGPELPDGSDPRQGAFRTVGDTESGTPAPVLRNLVIEDNTIIRHSTRILCADGLDGLRFRNNTIRESPKIPVLDAGPAIELGPSVMNTEIDP
jgi:hypothetical protein